MSRLVAAALLSGAIGIAWATAVVDLSLETMLERADVLVYGQVREVTVEPTDDELRTRVVLDVDRDLGRPGDPRSEAVLHFLGGRNGDDTVTVEGVPRFEVGERVLVFAYDEEDLASPIVGVWQGLWRLGPNGLADESGRILTPTPDGVAVDGEGGDLTEVLDALAAWTTGDARIVPAPPAEGAEEEAEAEEPEAELEEEDETNEEAEDEPVVLRLRSPDGAALRDTVTEAAAAWREAGFDVRVEWDEAAESRILAADPEPFGPDALALTIRRGGRPGAEIHVRSDVAASATGVVAYELAGLLGAPRQPTGLLSGRFGPEGTGAPSESDAAALANARDRLPGDLDGDGDVDFYDLARLAEAYGRTGARLEADLDDSGRVDDDDLMLLRERYEFLPPSPQPPPGRAGEDSDG